MPPPTDATPATELVVCMGSACFSRGNVRTVEVIQAYIKDRHLEDEVRVTGTLCQNHCRQGPNLTLGGECFCGIEPGTLPDLLDEHLGRRAKAAP